MQLRYQLSADVAGLLTACGFGKRYGMRKVPMRDLHVLVSNATSFASRVEAKRVCLDGFVWHWKWGRTVDYFLPPVRMTTEMLLMRPGHGSAGESGFPCGPVVNAFWGVEYWIDFISITRVSWDLLELSVCRPEWMWRNYSLPFRSCGYIYHSTGFLFRKVKLIGDSRRYQFVQGYPILIGAGVVVKDKNKDGDVPGRIDWQGTIEITFDVFFFSDWKDWSRHLTEASQKVKVVI